MLSVTLRDVKSRLVWKSHCSDPSLFWGRDLRDQIPSYFLILAVYADRENQDTQTSVPMSKHRGF